MKVRKAKDSQAILNAIEMGRNVLPQCVFDEENTGPGVECLESYRSEWDEDKQVLGNKPVKNFAIHGADAFRTFAQGYEERSTEDSEERRYRNHGTGGSCGYLGG